MAQGCNVVRSSQGSSVVRGGRGRGCSFRGGGNMVKGKCEREWRGRANILCRVGRNVGR
jgi:hypothetical protein